jgi:AcrR family transcriptional regulator
MNFIFRQSIHVRRLFAYHSASHMPVDVTLRERILDATVKVLRRHGAEKTNVVDVAAVLAMSPGNIYRFFSSKKALLEAVAARWMDEFAAPIRAIAADHNRPASDRLAMWFDALRKSKRRKLIDEPELFRVYLSTVGDARKAAAEHVKVLLRQLESIINDGKSSGEFPPNTNARSAARAFLHATAPFHHPALVIQHPSPTEAEARSLIRLLLAGLRAGVDIDTARPR